MVHNGIQLIKTSLRIALGQVYISQPTIESLNRAMERAITDENFLDSSINLLRGLKFPALKGAIVNYVSNATNDQDIVSLFQNLDRYTQFKDQDHVRMAIEENNPNKRTANQITNETRETPANASEESSNNG